MTGRGLEPVRGRPLFLLLDYDGTLVPIRRRPEDAVLSRPRREILRRLSRRTFVAVVSGRSLADIKGRIGVASVALVGNHGLEIACGARRWRHPGAEAVRGDLGRALAAVRRRLRGCPGLLVEDKGLTGSVHVRRVRPGRRAEVEAVVRDEIGRRRRTLMLTRGHCVLELRPRLAWNKGLGVRSLLAGLEAEGRPFVVYIGDDATDEDAFRVLRRDGVTIRVGGTGPTFARFRLPSVREVWVLLRRLERDLRPGP